MALARAVLVDLLLVVPRRLLVATLLLLAPAAPIASSSFPISFPALAGSRLLLLLSREVVLEALILPTEVAAKLCEAASIRMNVPHLLFVAPEGFRTHGVFPRP